MLKDQMAANNLLFPSNVSTTPSIATSNLANIDASANAANQLALLQSFTSEMTIPSQAQLIQQQNSQQQESVMMPNIKSEINNNNGNGSDEHMAH